MQRGKNFVRNLALHGDQIEGGHANRSARAHALRADIEQLPVQVESFIGAEKIAGEHK